MESSRKIELKALAVRGSKASSDTGMYCRIKYGKKVFKTHSIKKNESSDWKDMFLFTLESNENLVIECYQKGAKKRILKRFLGRVIITHLELRSISSMKDWIQLQTKPKKYFFSRKNKNITGQLFVSLAGIQSTQTLSNTVQTNNTQQASDIQNEPEVPKDSDNLEDTLFGQDSEVTLDFKRKAEAALRTVKMIEKDLAILEELLKEDKEKDKEISFMGNKIQSELKLGVKRLRNIGLELNNSENEIQLKQRISQNNYLNERFIKIVDQFTFIQSKYCLGKIQTTEQILIQAATGCKG